MKTSDAAARPVLHIVMLSFAMLLSSALTSCASNRFQSVNPSSPHAVVSFPPQEAQRGRLLFIEPVELNGLPRPRNWLRETFRVPPGNLELKLRAATDTLQGRCVLEFSVAEGQRYEIDATFATDVFTLRASRQGKTIDSCAATAEVLPVPLRIPGVPPTE